MLVLLSKSDDFTVYVMADCLDQVVMIDCHCHLADKDFFQIGLDFQPRITPTAEDKDKCSFTICRETYHCFTKGAGSHESFLVRILESFLARSLELFLVRSLESFLVRSHESFLVRILESFLARSLELFLVMSL
ncbi:hypothetical protein MAR_001978 [Mya arenaria]|uniref:Uncharacterized protein n=1 Tax=Mya arenaria TaxID=6604 RepID=A0ABY7FDA6_MYAAR|nr:hypothetical protein MAR_001978 [Mya arenaria]